MTEVNKHSIKFISTQLPYCCNLENVKYLIVAYIYCSMLRINDYYSIYKSETGLVETESKRRQLIEYKPEIKKKSEDHKLWWNCL